MITFTLCQYIETISRREPKSMTIIGCASSVGGKYGFGTPKNWAVKPVELGRRAVTGEGRCLK